MSKINERKLATATAIREAGEDQANVAETSDTLEAMWYTLGEWYLDEKIKFGDVSELFEKHIARVEKDRNKRAKKDRGAK